MVGRIVKAISGFYYIEYENKIYECRAKGILKKNKISPLVSDFAEFEIIDDETGLTSGIYRGMFEYIVANEETEQVDVVE